MTSYLEILMEKRTNDTDWKKPFKDYLFYFVFLSLIDLLISGTSLNKFRFTDVQRK